MNIIRSGLISLGLLALCGIGAAEEARQPNLRLEIASQPIGAALNEFAKQSGLQVFLSSEDGGGIITPRISGTYTPQDALQKLLADSGLQYEYLDERTVAVRGAKLDSTPQALKPIAAASAAGAMAMHFSQGEVGSVSEGVRQPAAPIESETPESEELVEIVVTAQKRLERLQDVPVPVTAISGETLVDHNQLRLQDFYANVPGLNLLSSSKGDALISIRGVTTGAAAGNPTVGITIDDVPYGSSSGYGAGGLGVPVPDLDPSDLAQVEVLRGPQGTLYGASSIGGLLKYVTVDPTFKGVSGRLQGGMSSVHHGSDVGYSARGSVNLPLGDTFAVRASGFGRRDPGYIDDPARAIDGVNKVDVQGGRVSGLWMPSESVSLKLSALFQDTKGYGASEVLVAPGLADLEQNNLRGSGGYDKKTQLYSATLKAKLGSTELTAVSGYNVNEDFSTQDFSTVLGAVMLNGVPGSGFDGFGVAGSSLVSDFETSKFTQEVRLTGTATQRVDWLLGLFYTDESSRVTQQFLAVDPGTGLTAGSFLRAQWPTTYEEVALFTDLTLHVTDRFDVQFGGRESRNEQSYSEIDAGLYGPVFFGLSDPIINPEVNTKDSSFTYLVTPRLKLNADFMLYARFASGYRAGGPNPTSTVFGLPPHFEPDESTNYEIGAKVDLLDSLLFIDTSVYYIDWKDIQLNVFDPRGALYFINGSRARSRGVEIALNLKPATGIKISTWAAWNEAELTESFPTDFTLYGQSGDRLPNSARFSGHLAFDHELPFAGSRTGFYGVLLNYVGDRIGGFLTTADGTAPLRQEFPSYTQIDLHAGIKSDAWALNVFATNVADKRGVIAGGAGTFNPIAFTYIQPRTIGMSVSRTF